jgi:hypothetical protein
MATLATKSRVMFHRVVECSSVIWLRTSATQFWQQPEIPMQCA